MDMGNQNTLSEMGIEHLLSNYDREMIKCSIITLKTRLEKITHLNVEKYMFALDLTHMLVVP